MSHYLINYYDERGRAVAKVSFKGSSGDARRRLRATAPGLLRAEICRIDPSRVGADF